MAALSSIAIGASSRTPRSGAQQTLRAAAVLTLAAVLSADWLDVRDSDEVELGFDFTLGTSTGCEIRILTSDDEATWYEESIYDTATGELSQAVIQVLATAVRTFRFAPARRYVRVDARALTAFAGTSLAIVGKGLYSARTTP